MPKYENQDFEASSYQSITSEDDVEARESFEAAKPEKSEACQLWIEQRIDEEKKSGKSHREIGRIIAAEISKYFKAKVKPATIAKKVDRQLATNVAESENGVKSSTHPAFKSRAKRTAKDGTARGRKPKALARNVLPLEPTPSTEAGGKSEEIRRLRQEVKELDQALARANARYDELENQLLKCRAELEKERLRRYANLTMEEQIELAFKEVQAETNCGGSN